MELNKSLEEVKDAAVTEETIATAPADRPLFAEFYDDWRRSMRAIARATAAYHPIRKRSSLTFEVYNRTVSKGKHDRKNIAEFFGKRMRHKLRDIGCPFHVYASAWSMAPRIASSGALHESDYELATHDGDNEAVSTQQNAESTAANTHVHQMEHVLSSDNAAEAAQAAYERQMREQLAEAEAQAQEEVQAMTDAQAQARAQAMLQSQHNHTQTQSVDAADILSASGHGSELLDGAIDSTMGDDVFPGSSAAQTTTTDVAVAANSNIQGTSSNDIQAPSKFEETMTLESLRKRIADFADEREWNEFHTPRNLLLALNGEVGELCEIFQWKGEVKNTADKEHLGEEISDVLIYLVRLADKCDVNLPAALNDKIAKNARKYPADLVRGSSKKYNEYKRMRITEESTL
ncbi:EAR protein [Phytophthora cactorum]|nr:EAR protein [Phytophthora cactorum]